MPKFESDLLWLNNTVRGLLRCTETQNETLRHQIDVIRELRSQIQRLAARLDDHMVNSRMFAPPPKVQRVDNSRQDCLELDELRDNDVNS